MVWVAIHGTGARAKKKVINSAVDPDFSVLGLFWVSASFDGKHLLPNTSHPTPNLVHKKLGELACGKVPLRIFRINDAAAESQLADLAVEDDFLHGAGRHEAIDIALFGLSISVNAAHSLLVVRWIPRCIQNDDSVSCRQGDSQGASAGRQQKQMRVIIDLRIVEVCLLRPGQGNMNRNRNGKKSMKESNDEEKKMNSRSTTRLRCIPWMSLARLMACVLPSSRK